MRSVKQVLSESETMQDVNRTSGRPAGIKDDTTTDTTVNDEALERAYKNVPAVFNSINKIYQTVMSRDRELQGPNSGFYRKWLDGVGSIGGNAPWSEIHSKIYKYQLIYGQAFVEIIRDGETGEPVDLAFLDPKKMDYAREGAGYGSTGGDIALDRYQNPVGYVQEVDSYDGDHVPQVYDVPDNVGLSNNQIYIPAENIAHFKFQEVGEGFYPNGLIDSVFPDAERSYQLKKDYADTAHINLFPTRVAYVGDENHEPTPEQIGEINSQMKQAKHSTEWTFPNHVDMEMLEAENPEALLDFFKHFNSEIAAGMGIPEAVAMGDGQDVNRATLGILDSMFQISLRDVINRTSRNIEKQIFEVIADYHGHSDVPEFEWDTDVPFGYKTEPDTDQINPGDTAGGDDVSRGDTNEQE